MLLSGNPVVTSIDRVEPAATNAAAVNYTVTFSEDVQGVDANDFTVLTSTGVAADAAVTVTPVDGHTYTVSVTGVTGNGIVGIDIVDDNSIQDLAGNALVGQGQFTKISQTLSAGQYIDSAQLSPDHSTIFYSIADGTFITSLWRRPVNGTESVKVDIELSDTEAIAWWYFESGSSDATVIVQDYATGRYKAVWEAPADGGAAIRLTHPLLATEDIQTWVFSPDGNTFAYSTYNSVTQQRVVWTVPATGGSPVQMDITFAANQYVYSIQFSPDGNEIAVALSNPGGYGAGALWLASTGDGTAVQLNASLNTGEAIYSFQFTADGSHVVYDVRNYTLGGYYTYYSWYYGGATSLWSAPTAGGPAVQLVSASTGEGVSSWRISGDGSSVIYDIRTYYNYNYYNNTSSPLGIWSTPISGGVTTLISPALGAGDSIGQWGFSPDSSVVYATIYTSASNTYSLWLGSTSGGAALSLSTSLSAGQSFYNLQFSPDSVNLLFTVYASGTRKAIWLVHTSDGTATLLSQPLGSDEFINNWGFSSDYSSVYFAIYNDSIDRHTSIWLAHTSGGAAVQVSPSLGATEFVNNWSFSPDSASFFFAIYDSSVNRYSSVWLVDTSTITAIQLSPTLAPTEQLSNFSFTEDGSHFWFNVYDSTLGYTTSLWIAAAPGGPATQVAIPLGANEVIGSWQVAADGSSIAYSIFNTLLNRDTSVWIAPTNGGAATQISTPIGANERIDAWKLSPDNGSVAFLIRNTAQSRITALWAAPTTGEPAVLVRSYSLGKTVGSWDWIAGNPGMGDDILFSSVIDNRTGTVLEIGTFSRADGSKTGPTYTIDQIVPTVTITPASSSPVTGTTATYTVTFSEDVLGVTADDFGLSLNGVTVGDPIQVTPVNGQIYTVTLTSISGNGTVGVNLVNSDNSVKDAAGNVVAATSGGILTVNAPDGPVQLSGTTLTVNGTSLADSITVTETSTLTVVLNGVSYVYTPAQVTQIFINGNDGNDTILVNSLLDGTALTADGGNDNDSIRASAAVATGVTLIGGNGSDLLIGGSGSDTLDGGIGNDWLNGREGSDVLIGGTGNDVYAFDNGAANQLDTVVELADEGTDLLNFSTLTTGVTVDLTSLTAIAGMIHRMVVVGEAGQEANFENISGGSGSDMLIGNAANNLIMGNLGNDTLKGNDGNDQLEGSDGKDTLYGGNGSDYMVGGIGDDWMNGGEGNDFMFGGQGDDAYAFDNTTVNQVDAVGEQLNEGTDTLTFISMSDNVTVNLSSDTALATMSHRIVQAAGAGQADNLENAYGGSGTDTLIGNGKINVLMGNGGSNVLSGGGGSDELHGGTDRSVLIGGSGGDVVLGGSDQDLLLSDGFDNEFNPLALQSLLVEWVQATSYQTRIDHIRGTTPGGLNGAFVLSPLTIAVDGSLDYLTGNGGQDWFLSSLTQDLVTDKAGDETVTDIDSVPV